MSENVRSLEAISEANKTPNNERSRIRSQIVSSITINLTLLSSGLCYYWAELFLTPNKGAWEVTALPIGAILGSIISALLLDRIGRKWSLYITSLPFLICWILIYMEKSWMILFVGRIVAGISIGATFTTVPVYLGELVETRIRGIAMAMMPLLFNLGYLVTSSVGRLLNGKMMALISIIPPVLFLLFAPWIPESPYYNLKKRKDRCAELNLTWLRRKKDIADEIKEMKQFVENEQEAGIAKLFTIPAQRETLLIVLLLIAGQQLSGLLAIQYYSNMIFKKISLYPADVLLIMGATSFATSILSASLIDILGRKPIFLTSSYGSTVCLLIMGICELLDKVGIMKLDSLFWASLLANILHTIAFAFGLLSIPYIVSSEVFPMNLKSYANAIVIIFGSLLAIIMGNINQLLINTFDFYIIFFIFAVSELIIAIVASICMPETRRKSFKQIQQILGGVRDNN